MKKKNNKGFMLTETLVVSTLIITVLLTVYIEFRRINRNINQGFNYDSVSSMYSLYNVKEYIEQENYSVMISRLDLNDYVDITDCDNYYFSDVNYCKAILNNADITKIIITKENMYSLLKNNTLDEELMSYIKRIKYEKADGYRLIASFKDGSFANVKILSGDAFEANLSNSCTSGIMKNFTINYLNSNNINIQDEYKGQAGCGTVINANDYIDIDDICYQFSTSSSASLNINVDETLNNIDLHYTKISPTITIYYKNLSDQVISVTTTTTVECGLELNPLNYKKTISGYKFDHASSDIINVSNNNIEITLYYVEGSES